MPPTIRRPSRLIRIHLALSLVGTVLTIPAIAAQDWILDIARYKPSVVNIERSSEIVFEAERQGTSFATGFVIDAESGIVATNRHVTGTSPSYVKINFHDGSFTEAKVLYYDPVQDFAFYKVDPETIGFELEEVTLGSWRELNVGEELLLIGNNEKEEYSIKYGTVTNLNVNKGNLYGSYIHTTFDRTGGASGSPVWNTRGEVIGIHSSGTDTSSFELPIDYVIEALRKLQMGVPIQRGGLGVDLDLTTIGEAIRHYGLPEACAAEIGESNSGGAPRVIQVTGVIPRTGAVDLLRPGDILYRANNELLRVVLFLLDRLIDARVGDDLDLVVYRNGEEISLTMPVVDLEEGKIRRFARFAGGIFHDVTLPLRHAIHLSTDGVFMPFAVAGSTFSRAGFKDREGGSKILITELNGHPIASLEDLIHAGDATPNGRHTFVVVRDFNLFDSSEKPRSLTFNLQYGPLEVFAWDQDKLDWLPERDGTRADSAGGTHN